MSKQIKDFMSSYDATTGISDTSYSMIDEITKSVVKENANYENSVIAKYCHKIGIDEDSYKRCLNEIIRLKEINNKLKQKISDLEYKLAQKEIEND